MPDNKDLILLNYYQNGALYKIYSTVLFLELILWYEWKNI